MTSNIDLLIELLFNNEAREDEKEDAAMYLGKYKEEKVLKALLKVVSNPNENFSIIDSAAESIGKIWVELGKFNKAQFESFPPLAQRVIFYYVMEHKESIIDDQLKEHLTRKFKLTND